MSDRPSVSIAEIQRAVCERFGVPLMEMKSHRRSRYIARPRQVAMYLARELTPASLSEIGRLFGDRDHTTIRWAVYVIGELRRADREFEEAISSIVGDLGSLVVWKPIPSMANYLASSDGQIRHCNSVVARKQQLAKYAQISFWDSARKKGAVRPVHSLVAETFLGPRQPGAEIRHLDGNPFNNNIKNLSYGSAEDNARDRRNHGRTASGERSGTCKIPDASVKEIRLRYKEGGTTQYVLADQYGISQAQVNNIVLGKQRLQAGALAEAVSAIEAELLNLPDPNQLILPFG